MTAEMTLGTRYDVAPIPPVPEHTRWVEVGPLRLGVEYRILNDDILDERYAGNEREAAIIDAARPAQLDDRGVSVHVCDAASGREHLRFDLFDEDPHYHYLHPDGGNVVILYDVNAFGEPLPWALECLRSRLPQMLAYAGAAALAARVDATTMHEAAREVEQLASAGAELLG